MNNKRFKFFLHHLSDISKSFNNSLTDFLSKKYLKNIRKDFENEKITILSNDCTGGVIYHQIGCRFDSPLINLRLNEFDFFKLLCNFDSYLDGELTELTAKQNYPVGLLSAENLDPITINFVHYKSFKEAKEKWEARKKRINKDRLFVIFNTCQIKTEKRVLFYYDRLMECPFSNKIQLTRFDLNKPNLIQIKIKKLSSRSNYVIQREKKLSSKRYIDQLNYKSFFLRD